jgi:two-component system, cell cycle response regulator
VESTNRTLIHILLLGEAERARGVRELLESEGFPRFQIAHVTALEFAAEHLATADMDIVRLIMESKREQTRAFVQAARAAAPDMLLVIRSESNDEALAVEALRQGAQDFLAKERLDRAALARALRYSIERHRLQMTLQSLTLIDDLTGLHNRRGFLALAGQHLRMVLRKGSALRVYLDLDDLKLINDTHGLLEGNRALIVTANTLRACFRQSDILARLGGDEFCVLMTDAGQDSALQVRKRLEQRIDFINALSSWRFRLSLSVGIAEVPVVNQPSLEELLRIADSDMYEEKRIKHLRSPSSPAHKQPAVL